MALISNVKWLEPSQWRPFTPGSAANYLGVSAETLNERQGKAKGADLHQKGKEVFAQVREKMTTKTPESGGAKRKRGEQLAAQTKPARDPPKGHFGPEN